MRTHSVQKALNLGNWSSIILTAIATYFLVNWIAACTNDTSRGVSFHFIGCLLCHYYRIGSWYINEHDYGILYRYGQTPCAFYYQAFRNRACYQYYWWFISGYGIYRCFLLLFWQAELLHLIILPDFMAYPLLPQV